MEEELRGNLGLELSQRLVASEVQLLIHTLKGLSDVFLVVLLELVILEWVSLGLFVRVFLGLSVELVLEVLQSTLVFSNNVSGQDQVVGVDVLDEGLDFDPSLDLLLRHVFVDLSWVSGNSSDEAVAELFVLLTVEVVGQNHGLLSGVFS